jgi:opacity protein-like surface antigen
VGMFNSTTITDKTTWHFPSAAWDSSSTEETKDSHIAPNFFSFALPFKASNRNVVVSLAYQRMLDFGSSQEKKLATYTWTDDQTGGVDAITPGLAIQITPQILFGAAANILVNGSTDKYEEKYTNGNWYKSESNMNFHGFNFNLGGMAIVNKMISVGVAARLPYTMSRDGDYNWSNSAGGSGDTTFPDKSSSWTMPLMIGGGIAVRPVENLTLAFDFEHRGYSSVEYTWKMNKVPGSLYDSTYNVGWMNSNQFRVGLEYVIVSNDLIFPVRLGFRTDPQLEAKQEWQQNATGWTADSTVMNGMTFTGGIGLKMGKLWLDLSGEYGIAPSWWEIDNHLPAGDVYENKTTEKKLNLLASAIYRF